MRKRDQAQARRLERAIRERLTYANVMSTLAVFGVLAGGGAYAASKIGPSDIKTNAVRSKHIKNGQVKAADLAANSVNGAKILDGSIGSRDLANSSVNSAKVADNSLTGADINEASLDNCGAAPPGTGQLVKAGSFCIDRYEASVWSSPTGGTQYGVVADDYPCDDNGQNCSNIYARSVPGVIPSRFITWFQAAQALANSGKRLPTNAEWQTAVAGTPDGAPCNVNSAGPVNTGAAAGCVSRFGANDMVGNLYEWVADWVPHSTGCGSWPAGYGDDSQCLAGADTTGAPGALARGGIWTMVTLAGPFNVSGANRASDSFSGIGFRGAR